MAVQSFKDGRGGVSPVAAAIVFILALFMSSLASVPIGMAQSNGASPADFPVQGTVEIHVQGNGTQYVLPGTPCTYHFYRCLKENESGTWSGDFGVATQSGGPPCTIDGVSCQSGIAVGSGTVDVVGQGTFNETAPCAGGTGYCTVVGTISCNSEYALSKVYNVAYTGSSILGTKELTFNLNVTDWAICTFSPPSPTVGASQNITFGSGSGYTVSISDLSQGSTASTTYVSVTITHGNGSIVPGIPEFPYQGTLAIATGLLITGAYFAARLKHRMRA